MFRAPFLSHSRLQELQIAFAMWHASRRVELATEHMRCVLLACMPRPRRAWLLGRSGAHLASPALISSTLTRPHSLALVFLPPDAVRHGHHELSSCPHHLSFLPPSKPSALPCFIVSPRPPSPCSSSEKVVSTSVPRFPPACVDRAPLSTIRKAEGTIEFIIDCRYSLTPASTHLATGKPSAKLRSHLFLSLFRGRRQISCAIKPKPRVFSVKWHRLRD